MRVRLTIGKRIGTGFGLFIFFAIVVMVLTNTALERGRALNTRINEVYGPSVDALVQLKNLVLNARMLIKHWALVVSIPDAPEKTTLIGLTDQELPELLDRIDTLSAHWDKEEVAMMSKVALEMDSLFGLHDRVKVLLPSLPSYDNAIIFLERSELAEEGGPLDQQADLVLADIEALMAMQERKRKELTDGMIMNFDSLKFFVIYLGGALVVVGILVAVFLVRSIVRPLGSVRAALLSLGRGVFPRTRIKTRNDELGDMNRALGGLIEGLKRTTDFSHAVAAGNFDADFQPMSNDDMLGKALLKMRDELGERERVLEAKVRERTEEMVRQKDEVERQSRKVVELYKNVTDSIRYAKRLQESILPPEKRIKELLPDSFVLYRPKDIVSGDFYWVERVGDKVLFAAVDCTGHGVPGAFMSLVGHNGLDQAIRQRRFAHPSEVLQDLNQIAYEMLHRDRDQFVRDGMDIALCALDTERMELEYAGANSPMYLVRDGHVMQYTADKRPIGGFEPQGVRFTDHRIKLRKGDVVYIFSDGYADQFGGEKGKKFMYRQFRELLTGIHEQPMERQKGLLIEALNDWKGSHEQVDDILVIGMRA